jgi:hypothetical protein
VVQYVFDDDETELSWKTILKMNVSFERYGEKNGMALALRMQVNLFSVLIHDNASGWSQFSYNTP